MILLHLFVATHFRSKIRLIKNVGEIETVCFPVIDSELRLKPIDSPNHLIHGSEAQLRHDLAHLHRNKTHKIDDVFGLAGKAFT